MSGTNLCSYPSIYNLGHRAIADLFSVPVIVEEKIDGSQFSFGIDEDGGLRARSKGAEIHINSPEGMFARAVDTVKSLAPLLQPGWTYRGEYLQKPKHNTLAYDRVPKGHIIIFDVNVGLEEYLSPGDKKRASEDLGLECVPLLDTGQEFDADRLRELLDRQSVLGGQKIEGVVIKPQFYDLYGPDKKVLMGKFVSEAFKEIHGKAWKLSNPGPTDIRDAIADRYRTPARWQKAVQHLAERGAITDSPKDIGALLKEVVADVDKECADEMQAQLWAWAWPHIRRKISHGIPEWYKEQLLQRQFQPVDIEGGNR